MGWKDAPVIEEKPKTPAWMSAPEVKSGGFRRAVGGALGRVAGSTFGPLGQYAGGKLGEYIAENPKDAALTALDLAPAAGAVGLPAVAAVGSGGTSTPASISLGALGAGAGEAARQLGRRALGADPTPPKEFFGAQIPEIPGVGKAASNIVTEAGMTGAMDTLALGVSKGLSVFSKNKAVRDMAVKAYERAKQFGMDLLPAEATGGKVASMSQGALARLPLSGSMIQNFKNTQIQQAERAASNLLDDFGVAAGREEVGIGTQKAIAERIARHRMVKDKAYDLVFKGIPEETLIPYNNTQTIAKKLLQSEYGKMAEAQNPQVVSLLNRMSSPRIAKDPLLGGKDIVDLPAKQFKSVRDTFSSLARQNYGKPEGVIYKQVIQALDDDLATFSDETGSAIAGRLKRANALHGSLKEFENNPNIVKIVNKNPEGIIDSVFRPKAVTEVKLLKRVLPEESFEKLRGSFVNKLFEGKGLANQNFAANFAKYDDETLTAILPKEQITKLKDFKGVLDDIARVEKLGGNPSGTAQTQVMMSLIQSGISMVNPVTGVVSIISPPTFAKIYMSPIGRKLITEGLKVTPGTARAGAIFSTINALANRMGEEK